MKLSLSESALLQHPGVGASKAGQVWQRCLGRGGHLWGGLLLPIFAFPDHKMLPLPLSVRRPLASFAQTSMHLPSSPAMVQTTWRPLTRSPSWTPPTPSRWLWSTAT